MGDHADIVEMLIDNYGVDVHAEAGILGVRTYICTVILTALFLLNPNFVQ